MTFSLTHHRALIAWVALGLVASVSAAAVLLPFESERAPEVTVVSEEMTKIPNTYSSEEAGFAVQFGNVVSPYRVIGMFAMPRERVEVDVVLPDLSEQYTLEASQGAVLPSGGGSWTWQAPEEPGLYPLHVIEVDTGRRLTINAFVKTPYSVEDGVLNGYRIGPYERTPLHGDPVYTPPDGFVEVTAENEATLVAPHFTLGQFLCKQESGDPKYVLLREQLLLKLERILHEVNAAGFSTPTLHVMSGFRTPFYNAAIGNTTSYSRHLYGGAADVYVDRDDDRYMDDLTGDGKVTRSDAVFMADIVENQRDEPWYAPLVGGLGIYSPAPHRGPFIHVDVRGSSVRW